MTTIKELAVGRRDVFNVDPRKLKIKEDWNSRDFNDPANLEHVDTLAQSIAAVGVKNPLTIYFEKGEPFVSDGECRLRAAMRAIEHYKAPLETVPVWTEDRYANEADRLLNQFIRNTGKQFSPIELSNHFKRLLGLGWKATDIAAKAGMSQARVSQILDLQTLPEPVKAMVVQKQVAASTAVALVKAEGGSEAEKQLKAGLEAAQAEGKTKVMPKHLPQAQPTPAAPAFTPVATPAIWPSTPAPKQLKAMVKEAFEASSIDNSDDNVVVIEMPYEQFEILRKELGL
jgi:ParB family chromosome partitioning protein